MNVSMEVNRLDALANDSRDSDVRDLAAIVRRLIKEPDYAERYRETEKVMRQTTQPLPGSPASNP